MTSPQDQGTRSLASAGPSVQTLRVSTSVPGADSGDSAVMRDLYRRQRAAARNRVPLRHWRNYFKRLRAKGEYGCCYAAESWMKSAYLAGWRAARRTGDK
jgi:hypothetical protein